jgi:hypothetical protein
MVDQMREGLAGNGDPELGSVGEVGQGLAPRRVLLTEDQLTFRALGCSPMRDTPLQRAEHARAKTAGMAAVELFEQRRGTDARHGLEQGHELLAPHLRKRVRAGPIGARRLLARQHWLGLDAPSCAFAEAGSGSRRRLGVTVSS